MTGFLLQCRNCRRISAALIDRDFVRKTVLLNGFLEEAPGGFLVAVGGQQEVDGLAVSIDGAVKVFPLALDLDVRFIYPPARADRAFLPFRTGTV